MSEKDGPSLTSIGRLDPIFYMAKPERWHDVKLWMVEHGLNPMSIPRDAQVLFLDEHTIEIETFYAPNGVPEIEKDTGEIVRRWVPVTIVRPFPMDCLES